MSVSGDPSQDTAHRYAERILKVLLAASIVLPILTFGGVSWIAYHRQFDQARDRLLRTLGNVHEHATKVFETFELTARYVDEVLDQVSDAEIRAAEQRYNARLRGLTELLPQLADVWIVDALRRRPHPTHPHLDQALAWIDRVGPRRAILTHMDNSMDYQALRAVLREDVEPGYDGMTIIL